jgi:hypothetical protein
MWYPEEPVTYCRECEREIPVHCYWRGRGVIIDVSGKQQRTPILYSQCPDCGHRYSVGLDGPRWHRSLYGWLWKVRYPNLRAPEPKFGR